MSDDIPTDEDPLEPYTKEPEELDVLDKTMFEDEYPDVADTNNIMESFKWLADDFTIRKSTEKSVVCRVRAGHGGVVSKNNRRYLSEEFMRAARTASGRKIDVNHNSVQIGKVPIADYENDTLEFVTEVWKEPYATLIRTRSPEIMGWSINANYLYTQCPKCGKKFSDEKAYRDHMVNEEFVRDAAIVPRGIHFGEFAISLVMKPETPGLDTSYEVMETVKGFNALCETVLKEKGLLSETVEKRGNQWCVIHCHGPDTGKPIKCFPTEAEAQKMHAAIQANEQEDIKPGSHYCEEHPDDPRCKEHKKAIHGEEQEEQKDEHGCIVGKEKWDGENCVPIEQPKPEEPKDLVKEAQTILDASPEPYQSAWRTVLKRFDEVVLNTPQYQAELIEHKRANDLREKELNKKITETTSLHETIKAQQKELDALRPLKEQLANETKRADNAEDKLKPKFKGKHVKETKTESKDTDIPTDKSPLEE